MPLSAFGLTKKFKSPSADHPPPPRRLSHQPRPGQLQSRSRSKSGPFFRSSAAAAGGSSSPSKAAPSAPPELENPNSESRVLHKDPKFQGAIRSHKKEQNTSKFRNNRSPGTNVTVKADNLGPNFCHVRAFPKSKLLPRTKTFNSQNSY